MPAHVAYAAAPAEAEAHVYETMAAIPGVTVDTHATTAVGQPAIGRASCRERVSTIV